MEMRLGDSALAGTQRAPLTISRPPPVVEMMSSTVNSMAGVFTRRATDEARPRTVAAPINVALFSSGGQWGAFSAGFMNGWSGNPVSQRPEAFDVVTGVSTGALIAPFVFAGPEYDDELAQVYYGVSEERILRRRNTVELVGRTSLWDPSPLGRTIDGHLDGPLTDSIAAASERRSLLVGAVNLNSGFFEVFDLTSMASSANPQRTGCMREALLASSAIPVAFPPRRIDDSLYIDGATRQGLFLQGLAEANVQPTLYIFLNTTEGFPFEEPEHSLPGVVSRASAIANDELFRSSAIETLLFAQEQGWTVRGVLAPEVWPGPDCDLQNGQKAAFCASFTRQLYQAGLAAGSAQPINWLGADELISTLRRQSTAMMQGG